MLLRVTSDIHLESHIHRMPNDTDWSEWMVPSRDRDSEAVLILAGDIMEFNLVPAMEQHLRRLAQRFKAVVWVPGNHEYYHSAAYSRATYYHYKERLRSLGKIFLLDSTSVVVDGVKIHGSTLWTSYNDNPIAKVICGQAIHDFRYTIMADGLRPTPDDYHHRHNLAITGIASEGDEPFIVISHFAPSFKSMAQKYANLNPFELNYHFVSELDGFIAARPQIKLWIHGHTHTQFDYTIAGTRVVCNPKGFVGEDIDARADLDYIEVDVHGANQNLE